MTDYTINILDDELDYAVEDDYYGLKNYKNNYHKNEHFEDYIYKKNLKIEEIIYFNAMIGNINKLKDIINYIHDKFDYNNINNINDIRHHYNIFLSNYKTMIRNFKAYVLYIDKLSNTFNDYLIKIKNQKDKSYYTTEYKNIKLEKQKININYEQIVNNFNILKNKDIVNFSSSFSDIFSVYKYLTKLKDILFDLKDILYKVYDCHKNLYTNIDKIKKIIKIQSFYNKDTYYDFDDQTDKQDNNKLDNNKIDNDKLNNNKPDNDKSNNDKPDNDKPDNNTLEYIYVKNSFEEDNKIEDKNKSKSFYSKLQDIKNSHKDYFLKRKNNSELNENEIIKKSKDEENDKNEINKKKEKIKELLLEISKDNNIELTNLLESFKK